MDSAAARPKLYLLRQEVKETDDDFAQKYKSIVDHLVEVIKQDGRLDLEESSSDERRFGGAAEDLRSTEGFQDRPFSFLFVKPSPENKKSLASTINSNYNIAETSAINLDTGKPDPALASSILMFNRQGQETNSHYNDLMQLFTSFDFLDADAVATSLEENLSSLTNMSIDNPELVTKIESYGKELVDHTIAMHKARESTGESAQEELVQLGNKDTIGVLNSDQQQKIYFVDWQEQIDQAPQDTRFQVMYRLMEEASAQDIAAELGISVSQINQVLNAFLQDQDEFLSPLR